MQVVGERLLAANVDRHQLDPVDQRAQDVGGFGSVVGMVQDGA